MTRPSITPGPWVASHYMDTEEVGVISHDNLIVVGLASRLTESNARAISAVPDLLAVCEEILIREGEMEGEPKDWEEVKDMLIAAYVKAGSVE